MTNDDNKMDVSRAERKSVVLVPRQNEITIEIDDDVNVILRQEDALGDDPDGIVIARPNVESFISDLFECALPKASFPPRFDPPARADRHRPRAAIPPPPIASVATASASV
jgi:hypothetical protein